MSIKNLPVSPPISPKHLTSLSEILSAYEIFLVDMVGVVYDGLTPYPGVIAQLNQLIATKKVIILSNNPRPNHVATQSLKKMGISGQYTVITSGDYSRDYLVDNHSHHKVFHLGQKTNTDITEGLKITTTNNLSEADCVLLTSFIDDNQDPHQFDELLKQITERNIPVLCANPDVYALFGAAVRKTAGYFAQRLLDFGLPVTQLKILGKPNPHFYEYAAVQVRDLNNKKSVLMIGDTIETDIAGAHHFGIDSLLTLSGITGMKINHQPGEVYAPQVSPTYIIDRLG